MPDTTKCRTDAPSQRVGSITLGVNMFGSGYRITEPSLIVKNNVGWDARLTTRFDDYAYYSAPSGNGLP